MQYLSFLGAAGMAASAVLMSPSAHAASDQPLAGIYETNLLYTAVTPTGGATCPAVGSTAVVAFTYPGAGKAGAVFHVGGLNAAQFEIRKAVFPKTPATGATSWGGKVVEYNSASTSTKSISFSAVLKFYDPSSFLATFHWNEPGGSGAGTCDEIIEMTFIRL